MVTPPSHAPRRWPPLASGIAAGLLVFLVLPNPLKVPQQNPTATAEYAPVPGTSDDNAEGANFGETGLADSAGIGSGGIGSGAIPGLIQPPPPPQFRPRQKACVGTNPPRQTVDPLSPPCVPFFDGDNGGQTYRGVTSTEIKVAFYNDMGVTGDMNEPYEPSQEQRPDGIAPYENVNLVRTIKAQLRYFQQHYQTYGRTVRLIAQKSASGLTTACAARQGDAIATRDEIDPFAAVHLGDGGQCYMQELAEKYQIPVFGLNSDVKRSIYEGNRGFIWGFFPDQEAEAQWSAGFLCRSIAFNADGTPATAKWTTDPNVDGKPRKFGFVVPEGSARGPESEELAVLLHDYVKDMCGIDLYAHYETFNSGGAAAAGHSEAPTIMRKFRDEGVTTVICYCVPVPSETTVTAMQNAAKSLNYRPEWYWDHASRMFRAIWERQYGDPNQSSFGVSQHWRQPAYRNQYHYQAFKEMEPGSEPNAFMNFDIYHLFLNLFEAIQAAGPQLTPKTVEQGMFTFNYLSDKNPYVPTGGYGPYDSPIHSPVADYTFVDTGMAWWWDPSGRAPGESENGCLRVAHQGKRFYWDKWPKGDTGLFTDPPGPCTPDDRKLLENGATF